MLNYKSTNLLRSRLQPCALGHVASVGFGGIETRHLYSVVSWVDNNLFNFRREHSNVQHIHTVVSFQLFSDSGFPRLTSRCLRIWGFCVFVGDTLPVSREWNAEENRTHVSQTATCPNQSSNAAEGGTPLISIKWPEGPTAPVEFASFSIFSITSRLYPCVWVSLGGGGGCVALPRDLVAVFTILNSWRWVAWLLW